MNGTINSAVTVNGGTLSGSGNTGTVTVNSGGTFAPGKNGSGILDVAGNLTLQLGAVYLVNVNGTAAGQYSQTHVTGLVSLGGASLSLTLSAAVPIGVGLTIVDKDGRNQVDGTFDGLSEGASFDVDGETFRISYVGGDGNDVVLTSVVPEPRTWMLLAIGFATFLRVCGYRASRKRSAP